MNYRPRRALPECAQAGAISGADGERQSATGGAYCVQPEAIAAPPAELAEQPVSRKILITSPSHWCWRQKTYASSTVRCGKNESAILANAEYSGGKTRYQTSDRSYWDDQLQLTLTRRCIRAAQFQPRCNKLKATKNLCLAGRTGKTGCAATRSVAYANWTGARGREEAGLAHPKVRTKREMCTKMNINWANQSE